MLSACTSRCTDPAVLHAHLTAAARGATGPAGAAARRGDRRVHRRADHARHPDQDPRQADRRPARRARRRAHLPQPAPRSDPARGPDPRPGLAAGHLALPAGPPALRPRPARRAPAARHHGADGARSGLSERGRVRAAPGPRGEPARTATGFPGTVTTPARGETCSRAEQPVANPARKLPDLRQGYLPSRHGSLRGCGCRWWGCRDVCRSRIGPRPAQDRAHRRRRPLEPAGGRHRRLLGHDGRPPRELYADAWRELARCPTVRHVPGTAAALHRTDAHEWSVRPHDGSAILSAEHVLLAMGMRTKLVDCSSRPDTSNILISLDAQESRSARPATSSSTNSAAPIRQASGQLAT